MTGRRRARRSHAGVLLAIAVIATPLGIALVVALFRGLAVLVLLGATGWAAFRAG